MITIDVLLEFYRDFWGGDVGLDGYDSIHFRQLADNIENAAVSVLCFW